MVQKNYITVFKTSRNWTPTWATWTPSTPSRAIYRRSCLFPLLRSRQKIWSSSRLLWHLNFLRWGVNPMPYPQAERRPFSALRACLVNIFITILNNCRPSPLSTAQECVIPWWQGTQLRWTTYKILIAHRTNQILIFQIRFITTLLERNWRSWWIVVISEDDGVRESYIKVPGTCTGFGLVRKAITQVSQISTVTIHEQ
jgi:hypothetical protein